MKSKQAGKKSFISKLLTKYRLVLLNDSTYEEKSSFKISRLNVFSILFALMFIIVLITSGILFFTPIREYIPGYSSTSLQKQANLLSYKTDSLRQIVFLNDQYINSLKKVLTGDLETIEYKADSVISKDILDLQIIEKSKEDSILRQLVNNEDKYNLDNINKNKDFYLLSAPINGAVSQNYSIADDHLAIDISVDIGTPVKAVSNGRVILSEWTTQTGYVLIIDHGNDLISVYKHNSKLLKSQGEIVKQDEIIALSGNSGVLTSGPHLHFELWSEGFSIDPNTLINFE
ncbi:M23 family metallopeptidase [Flavobacteriaceae bacterium]|jgi:murein DD-endopeptidase MepM/ murein hydrolase activator NlpD|nr:M23 family metallopeptidase [Flavobacteriaceae bacterium]MDB2321889.1 M23 family metallopeptidase [Flavobacteriaceae bacterium]MDB2354655.1 M23 family metallopeptidase [Flavobacteriaceae bacterium]MDC0477452.1 M23 family metallopeptidase [Flavobacteriaceae bacterium]MDC1179744.1 M23 family metallopeptidase [Flavobacteriaceae bacterium]|tara:strand:- start:9 stop:872 length:864 start_codon:yes stop_codon:yes gene_type:complete